MHLIFHAVFLTSQKNMLPQYYIKQNSLYVTVQLSSSLPSGQSSFPSHTTLEVTQPPEAQGHWLAEQVVSLVKGAPVVVTSVPVPVYVSVVVVEPSAETNKHFLHLNKLYIG